MGLQRDPLLQAPFILLDSSWSGPHMQTQLSPLPVIVPDWSPEPL